MTEQTYWAGNGKYQAQADALRALVPTFGPVENAKKRPALERYRKATNCYYDLYNNGLGNRAGQFASVFKIRSTDYKYARCEYNRQLYAVTETTMDAIIVEAAIECGIEVALEV
jgi:hypothetical protein